jgi:phage terminase large subunit-like protein
VVEIPSLSALEAEQRRRARNKITTYFPENGPCRRELYARHMDFIAAGASHLERLFMAANRVGKTDLGAYETTCHLTGIYPAWWNGKRFPHAIDAWAAGINNATTRDVIQQKLLGNPGEIGTGFIPGDSIIHVSNRQGLAGAVDTVYVRHASGGRSVLGFKSYEMGRESFQGTAKHLVWLDEEPDQAVYTEALMRTATTDGIALLTFTPLLGMSDVVKSFLEPSDEAQAVKHTTIATWDDVPHLSAQAKTALLAAIPPHQRDARTKGVPSLGVGQIYPIAESDITVPRFDIPKHWPRWFGLDVGWNRTAAVWFALDRDTRRAYIYHEHYRGNAEPAIHAQAIKAPGDWIPGVIDPASLGSGQIDGRQLIEMYQGLGLDLEPAINSVETGIYEVWSALSSGQLKVFGDLANWLSEFRKYHRDEKGRIVKRDDHAMDATRYGWMSGRDRAQSPPVKQENEFGGSFGSSHGWMG